MIIHINGVPGSGKTTLGKEISNRFNIDVVDLDDIFIANSLNIWSKYNVDESDKNQTEPYISELLKINQECIN